MQLSHLLVQTSQQAEMAYFLGFLAYSITFGFQVGGAPCEGRAGRRPRTQVPGERKC